MSRHLWTHRRPPALDLRTPLNAADRPAHEAIARALIRAEGHVFVHGWSTLRAILRATETDPKLRASTLAVFGRHINNVPLERWDGLRTINERLRELRACAATIAPDLSAAPDLASDHDATPSPTARLA